MEDGTNNDPIRCPGTPGELGKLLTALSPHTFLGGLTMCWALNRTGDHQSDQLFKLDVLYGE